jgi:hypothetical protein
MRDSNRNHDLETALERIRESRSCQAPFRHERTASLNSAHDPDSPGRTWIHGSVFNLVFHSLKK